MPLGKPLKATPIGILKGRALKAGAGTQCPLSYLSLPFGEGWGGDESIGHAVPITLSSTISLYKSHTPWDS